MLDDKIKKAHSIIKKEIDMENYYNHFSKIYLFSNENCRYLRAQNYIDSSALTTGSSSDQVFNLINYGCRDITLFDINPFKEEFFELKRAAVLLLNKQELVDFFQKSFFIDNKVFNQKVFNHLLTYMSDDSKKFWSDMFNNFSRKDIYNNLFFEGVKDKKSIINNNDYLNNLKLLRRKLEYANVKFIDKDITKLKDLPYKYDYMFLSNILDYIFDFINKTLKESKQEFNNYYLALMQLSELLNDNGKMFFHYFWNYSNNELFIHLYEFLLSLENNNINYMEIHDSSGAKNYYDSVLTYTKK